MNALGAMLMAMGTASLTAGVVQVGSEEPVLGVIGGFILLIMGAIVGAEK